MAKLLSGVLIGILLCGLAFASLFFWGVYQPLQLIAKAQGPNGEWFGVFADYPAGDYDPSWHIYRFSSLDELESAKIENVFGKGALLETYEEGGDHDEDATIEVVNDRFLVFSKAGMFHALYDLRCDRVVVEDGSPWNSAWEHFGQDRKLDDPEWPRFYLQWKLDHLHRPIAAAIAANKRCAA
ncbi:MAG: hypothetical protein R3F21_02560 [Myxococcota bacterium]